MMDILPFTPSDNNYRLRVPLGGTYYLLDVRWNSRDNVDPATGKPRGAWYFDIREDNEKPIALGIKVVLGPMLGATSTHPFFTQHAFRAVDTSGQERDAGFDDIGTRVVVLHVTADEVFDDFEVF